MISLCPPLPLSCPDPAVASFSFSSLFLPDELFLSVTQPGKTQKKKKWHVKKEPKKDKHTFPQGRISGADLSILDRALMSACLCGCTYGVVRAFGGFTVTRGGERRVDERRLTAKQSISPSHRPHHTSQTHPSLLTQ